ncbi:MAG: hypothetical protein WDM79_06425 [Terricaulis sp.]
MSSIVTSTSRRGGDHFEPEAQLDPHEQRRLRGHLEQIDYAAFAAKSRDAREGFRRDRYPHVRAPCGCGGASTCALVGTAITIAGPNQSPTPQQVAQLTMLRQAYEELTEAYEGLRRIVERAYVSYQPKA